MVRPRPSMFALSLPLIAGALLASACSSPPEQQQLKKYFDASRMRDNGTLANIATVSFSPTERGTVTGFEIVSVTPETRRPLKIKELAAAEEAARLADEEFNKKKKEYQDGNLTAIERVLKAEAARASLRGADAEVQKAWTTWREQAAEHAKKLADARKALGSERSFAEISVYDARNPVDATKYDGELVEKEVTIKAKVRAADGTVQDKDLTVKMMKADLTGGPEGKTVNGRWIITGITGDGAGGAPTN